MNYSILEQQHSQIRGQLLDFKSAWRNHDPAQCKILIQDLVDLLKAHQKTEFETLFARVWENPRLREGGPFCTYFFDFFMLNRPFELVKKRINQLRGPNEKLTEILIPFEYRDIFSKKSMVCIPLEEHLAIMALTCEIAEALKQLDSNTSQWVTRALEDLENLISFNIEKEEKCFWSLLQQI